MNIWRCQSIFAEAAEAEKRFEQLQREREALENEKDSADPNRLWKDLDILHELRKALAAEERNTINAKARLTHYRKQSEDMKSETRQTNALAKKVRTELQETCDHIETLEAVLRAAENIQWTGDWECSVCTWQNSGTEDVCHLCLHPRKREHA